LTASCTNPKATPLNSQTVSVNNKLASLQLYLALLLRGLHPMKITKSVTIPHEKLINFLIDSKGKLLEFVDVDIKEQRVTFRITEEVTEPTFNIQNLHDIAEYNKLTLEQQNAIDYGISAIKTLIDMGVLE
jgi:hypothetical protein